MIDEMVVEIDNRLAELASEKTRLKAARSALMGAAEATRPVSNGRSTTKKKRDRLQQFVAVVKANPGITVAEATKLMPNPTRYMGSYIHKLRATAVEQQLIVQVGSKLYGSAEDLSDIL